MLLEAKKAAQCKWLLPFLGQIPAEGLADAGVPAELAGKQHQAHQYLTQKLSGGASRRQVMVMTLGYEGSGKSSVVWRLRNPDLESLMPSLNSTDGISTCTTKRCCCCCKHAH